MLLLPRDLGDDLEIRVIVKHDQIAGLGDRGNEAVNERNSPMLAPRREGSLDLQSPTVIGVGDQDRRK